MSKLFSYLSISLALLLTLQSPMVLPKVSDNTIKTLVHSLKLKKGNVRFEIHATEEEMPFALATLDILESYAEPIFEYFDYYPSTTIHMTIDMDKTVANGTATPFPRNAIKLFAFPPTGSSTLLSSDSTLKLLVLHELTHIIHLDQTRGVNQALRVLYGNLATMIPSMVPDWFAEGIATWAETKFTQGGRQRSLQVRYEVERALLDPEFCTRLECLDDPGIYPYGSSAYWIGADFMTWIEELQGGNISCLVQANSGALPLTLGSAFEHCLKDNMNNLFSRYRSERVAAIKRRKENLAKSRIFKKWSQLVRAELPGVIRLDKGVGFTDGKLYYVSHKDQINRLTVFDFSDSKSSQYKLDVAVTNIMPPPLNSASDIVISAADYHRLRRHRQAFTIKDGEVKKLLPYKLGAEYPFRLDQERTLFFKWDELAWEIWLHKEGSTRLLHRFSQMAEIYQPRIFRHRGALWLSFKSYHQSDNKPHQLWAFKIGDNYKVEPRLLFSSAKAFRYFEQCGGKHLLSGLEGKDYLVDLNGTQSFKSSILKEIAKIRWNNNGSVFFLKDDPQAVYYLKKGCSKVVSEITERIVDKKRTKNYTEVRKRKIELKSEIVSYPQKHHFYPRWWKFQYSSNRKERNFSVATSINDPKDRHNISLDINLAPDSNSTTLGARYAYSVGDNILALTSSSFKKGGVKSRRISYARKFRPGPFSYIPSVGYRYATVSSIRSKVKIRDTELDQTLSYKKVNYEDFLQAASTTLGITNRQDPRAGDFMIYHSKVRAELYPARDLWVRFKMSYEKMQKDNVTGGVIFAGGNEEPHDFFGISADKAIGNEMMTARLQLEHELFRIFKPLGAVYMRKINFLLGAEALKSEFPSIGVSADELSEYYDDLRSYHAGFRFKMRLVDRFYARADILYIKTDNLRPVDASEDGWAFFISSSIPSL